MIPPAKNSSLTSSIISFEGSILFWDIISLISLAASTPTSEEIKKSSKEKVNYSMVKYLALLFILSNYVQCQSQFQKESIHPDNLNFLNKAYKLHITNQQSQLLNEYKID